MSVLSRDLSAVLEPYRDCSSNFGRPDRPLADHLPMGVSALAAMGASDQRLAEWAALYARRNALRPAEKTERDGRLRWRERIARDGVRAALEHAVETSGNGLGAAAFHAVIRAAYALQRGDDDDLACALESWEREYVALPVAESTERFSAEDALEALASAPLDRSVPPGFLIADRMTALGERSGFPEIAAVVPSASALDELTRAAAAAFAKSCNFTALHIMTGTHAFRALTRYVDANALMPAFWSAYAAAAIVSGVQLAAGGPPAALPDKDTGWRPLLAAAISNDDDHVIKSTYTAWQLHKELGDPVYRSAAIAYLTKDEARRG